MSKIRFRAMSDQEVQAASAERLKEAGVPAAGRGEMPADKASLEPPPFELSSDVAAAPAGKKPRRSRSAEKPSKEPPSES